MFLTAQDTLLADIEIHLLLEAVYRVTGCDFREYTLSMLRRRITECMRAEQVATISGLQEKALHQPACMGRLVQGIAAAPKALFRDPAFFRSFRTLVVPLLRTYSFVRMWNAECSIGEDAYALAWILHEEGLAHRCKIYATTTSETALAQAKKGIFSGSTIEDFANLYAECNGDTSMNEHFHVLGDQVIVAEHLRENVIFAQHSLAVDGSFNDFHVIVTRNALSCFTKTLQFRVHHLLFASLTRSGVLALGSKGGIEHTPHHCCPVKNPTNSTDSRHLLNRFCHRTAAMPMK